MLDNLRLIEPNSNYKEKLLENIDDYRKNKEFNYVEMYEKASDDFEQYVSTLIKHSYGKDLPSGWTIPYSTYWLINNDGDIVGVSRIRHNELSLHGHIGYDVPPRYRNKGYATELLRLSLEKAKIIGLDQVVITCNEKNLPSIKVICNNNGILVKKIFDYVDNIVYLQYIIHLK